MKSENNSVVAQEHNSEPQTGYDIPVYGLEDGTFYTIHIPALMCLLASGVCVVISLLWSFRRKPMTTFYRKWSKSERLIVYRAVCDGIYSMAHFTDHLHITITKSMVYPKELCQFYGFIIVIFMMAQSLIVNAVAIDVFLTMFFNKILNFGKKDWKLLMWAFGLPTSGAIVFWATDQLGPTGTFCLFDDVKGRFVKLISTSVPLCIVLIVNVILYVLTWVKIYRQTQEAMISLGTSSNHRRAITRSARTMSLFVAVFIFQWCPGTVYGAWTAFDVNVPVALVHAVVIFSNIGGVLNLCLLLVIHSRQRPKDDTSHLSQTSGTQRLDLRKSNLSMNKI